MNALHIGKGFIVPRGEWERIRDQINYTGEWHFNYEDTDWIDNFLNFLCRKLHQDHNIWFSYFSPNDIYRNEKVGSNLYNLLQDAGLDIYTENYAIIGAFAEIVEDRICEQRDHVKFQIETIHDIYNCDMSKIESDLQLKLQYMSIPTYE